VPVVILAPVMSSQAAVIRSWYWLMSKGVRQRKKPPPAIISRQMIRARKRVFFLGLRKDTLSSARSLSDVLKGFLQGASTARGLFS